MFSVVSGYLSWRYVENPARAIDLKRNATSLLATAAVLTTVFFVFGVTAVLSDGYRFMFPKQNLLYEDYVDYEMSARSGVCFLHSKANDIDLFDEQACININPKRRNFLILGDSHAAHYYSALKTYDLNISQATSSGCRPTVRLVGEVRCTELMRRALTRYIKENKFDAVILSGNWQIYDVEPLLDTVALINEYTDRVIVLGPVIQYSQALPVLLARFADGKKEPRQIKKARLYEQIAEIDARLKSALRDSSAEYYSALDIMCPNTQCVTTDENGIPLQFDYGHLTYEGAILILRSVLGAPPNGNIAETLGGAT